MTKNLISYNSSIDYKNLVDYIYFIIQKVTIKVIITFVTERFIIYMNIIKKVAK